MTAANRAVSPPTIATVSIACGECMYSGAIRQVTYTPAVTIVAAWIRADTGVGPAIASGSHTYNGICADFPHAPTNSNSAASVHTPVPSVPTFPRIPWMSSVPVAANSTSIPRTNPTSPIRFTMNAFRPASAHVIFVFSSNIRS